MKLQIVLLTRFLLVSLFFQSCVSDPDKPAFVRLFTTHGEIKLKLYNDTPIHRDNFIKLVKEGFYDGIRFHRVIEDFMIQAGDPSTRPDLKNDTSATYRYTIPSEITASHFHKKGVLAAARAGDRGNPDRRSSGTQFYIVQGKRFLNDTLESGEIIISESLFSDVEKRINSGLKQNVFYKNLRAIRDEVEKSGDQVSEAEIQQKATLNAYDEMESLGDYIIPPENRDVYETIGGTPHLDMQYTVFGEVIEGLEVIDIIAGVDTNTSNKPDEDVIIIKARLVRK